MPSAWCCSAAGQNLRLILRAIEAFFARRSPSLWKHDWRSMTLWWLSGLPLPHRAGRALSAKHYMPSQTNRLAALPA